MDLFEAMEHRHAVRSYEDRPIAPEAREALLACIAQCNRESGLHIQLVLDIKNSLWSAPMPITSGLLFRATTILSGWSLSITAMA